ncbi:hypothetical protein [Vreelandella populi]|uniref:hypothetical protein n=1 Tax=Vreelandella populi TaxID=2498858 RepID=UPI000F8E9D2C|nr:hypothetical protein [Halomonas populi]RUR42391.1 hypothetical protein ELY25_00400 [Halomonas populi]
MNEMPKNILFFKFICVTASSLGIDYNEVIYKKRKGALIVDTITKFLEVNNRESFLLFLNIIRQMMFESREIRKWINNNLQRIENNNLNEIDVLSLYVELDASLDEPLFYSLYLKKIKEMAEKGDIQRLSDIYNFLWGVSRYENSHKSEITIFGKDRKFFYLKKISLFALEEIENYLLNNNLMTNKDGFKNKDANDCTIVIGIGFIPGHIEATHLNYIYNISMSIKQAFANSKIYLAITGEPVVNSVYTGLAYNEKVILDFKNLWSEVNGDESFIYINRKSRINDFSEWISTISPDLFFSVGGVFKTEVCSRIVYSVHNIPVIFLPASNSNKLSFPVNGVLAANEEIYQELSNQNKIRNCFLLRPYNRTLLNDEPFSDFNIRTSIKEFVAVTVLNSNRIAKWFESLNVQEIQSLVEFLDSHKEIKLLFVGETNPERIHCIDERIKSLILQERIIIVGQVKNLRGLYKNVDVVFSLPGVTGGGGAIKAALYDEIPCICWYRNDACLHIPKVYQYNDFESLLSNIVQANADPLYRENNVRNCNELKEKVKNEESISAWQNAISVWVQSNSSFL